MKVTLLTLVTLGALVGVGASLGASPPVVAKTLAVGQMKATTIHATTGAAILTEITIAPGGSFGWHEHGSPVAVIVKSGTLTVLDPTIDGCKPFKVTKGAAF